MKVLKAPCNSEDWARELECEHCGRVLEIYRDDLYQRKIHDIGGPRVMVLVKCVCTRVITLADPMTEKWGDLPDQPPGYR